MRTFSTPSATCVSGPDRVEEVVLRHQLAAALDRRHDGDRDPALGPIESVALYSTTPARRETRKDTEMEMSRRNYLAAGGSLLAASALSIPALAHAGKQDGDTLYGHGQVWNLDLPGVLGELRLSFDMRVNLENGTGFGTAEDPVHPEHNIHFDVSSVAREKRPKGESRFTMEGSVIAANDPANVGLPVAIIAETVGDTTAIAIRIGENAFGGAGLVVIAIIAILIGLLIPAVQKVR